jgi:hypothetical protein
MKRRWAWREPLMIVGLSGGMLLFARQFWLSYLDARALEWHHLARPDALALTILAGLLIYVAQMIAWQFTLKYLDVKLGLPQIFEGFQLSLLPRYIPGSVWGYLGRSQWLEQFHNVSYPVSGTGSLLEIAVQALTAFIVGLGCLGLTLGGELRWLVVGSAVVLLAALCFAGPLVVPAIGRRITKSRSFAVRSTGIWLWVIVANMALRVVYGLTLWGVIRVVIPSETVGWREALATSNLSWLLGFLIPIIPTGLGVREWALATLLTYSGSLSVTQANLTAVLFRLVLILTELVWLAVGLSLYARRWRIQSSSRAITTRRGHR